MTYWISMVSEIPPWEFEERIRRVQRELGSRGLDAVIVHSNEADFANVRYLSDYWPAFESAGVDCPRRWRANIVGRSGK
jgi:hypothetical protein